MESGSVLCAVPVRKKKAKAKMARDAPVANKIGNKYRDFISRVLRLAAGLSSKQCLMTVLGILLHAALCLSEIRYLLMPNKLALLSATTESRLLDWVIEKKRGNCLF